MTERTTGATDAQIEAAAKRAWEATGSLVPFEDVETGGWFADGDKRLMAEEWAGHFVRPGQVIVDAAKVPTAEELAALNLILRELDSADMIEHLDRNDAPGWGYPYDAVEALRSYLERQP